MENKSQSDLSTLATVIEGFGDAMFSQDLNNNITSWNMGAQKLFDYGEAEIIGQRIFLLIPAGLEQEQDEILAKVLREESVVKVKSNRRQNGGEEIPVSLMAYPVKDETGQLVGVSYLVRDLRIEGFASDRDSMLAAIIEGSDDAIISKTLEGYITSWNRGAERIFGYTAAEAIGRHITILIPQNRFSEEVHIINSIKRGEYIQHFETERITKDGRLVTISLSISPIRNAMNEIIGVSKIARNITSQKLAAEKQVMLAAIIEGSDDAIVSKTLEGHITSWNAGAFRVFGYTEEEMIGQHITKLIPAYRLQEEVEIINNIKNGNRIEHFETTRLHKLGHEMDISLTISPIKDLNGTIIGASKIARDITEEKRAKEIINQQVKKLEILNSIGKLISEKMDVEFVLQKVTDATTQLVGAAFGAFFYNTVDESGEAFMLYTLSGAPREAFEKFGMPRNTAVFDPTFKGEGVVRVDDITKDPRYGKNSPHQGMPQGHLPVVSYLAVPVVSATGNVLGGLFFGHPEPGMFKAEHEDLVVSLASQTSVALDNSKLFEEVKELSRKKDEFIALATHELKTPLTSMSGYMQLLQKKITDEKNAVFIDKAISQLAKLNTLITDLFDIAKVQAGKLQLQIEEIELTRFLADVVEGLRSTSNTHRLQYSHGQPIWIAGDKIRLEQVMANLVGNAIKYSPKADEVVVEVRLENKEAVVLVKDKGLGISPENLKNIFSQFYRVEGVNSNISGLGLGLYISKEIVERHHGQIEVESEYKKGSVFSFRMPVIEKK